MNEVEKILENIPKDDWTLISIIARKKSVSPASILNTSAITYFANIMKLTLNDYQTIYLENGRKISGYSMRLEQKGKEAWKDGSHGMPNHLKIIFEAFGDEEVNKNLLEYAIRLINFTLENIFENGSEIKKVRYREALNKPNFIYMMLQIAIRLLAFDLKERGVVLENETMNYMIEMIKKDKEEIKEMFEKCISEEDTQIAIEKYYEKLSKYYIDFLDKEFIQKGRQLIKIGEEQGILNLLSEETLFTFLGFLIESIRVKYNKQMALYNVSMITIK